MAHRPERTFRQRRAESSDSDSTQEPFAEPGSPGEQANLGPAEEGLPSGGGRAEAAELPRRARGRSRGRVWASSRHAARAAPRLDGGSDVPESRAVDLSTDEEDETHRSSESKDDQSSSSNSSSSLEEEFTSLVWIHFISCPIAVARTAKTMLNRSVNIPDAAFIQAAYRKRELARAQEDYISLDVKHAFTISGMKKNTEYPESETDDHENIIPFTTKPQTLRQKMAEKTATRNEETSEDSEEDKKYQDIWEQQQMRKAVKITKGRDIDLSHSSKSQTVKKFDASISFPPVNLEIIKKQLNTRLTLLQDTHRSHLREYEKYIQDVKSSKSTIQNLENSSNQVLNFKFYKSMKVYVENLIDCLNKKIINIQEIESAMHALLVKQAMIFTKRRQDELKHESAYLQQLSRKAETSTNRSLAIDEKTQWILEEIESRRARRRQARVLSGNCTHQEGTSSDDELSSADMIDFQKSQGDILEDHKKIFEDVHDDFCNIQNILLKFQQWREKFPDSYYEAFISLCIPKLLNPLIRFQLIDWNPLKFDSIGLKQMPWFTSIAEFIDSSMEDSKKDDSSDKKILSTVISKIIIPRLTDFVEFIWDPLSTSQTTNLITQSRMILEEHSTCENEVISKGKQDLLKPIASRMKKAIDDDVFIPLYPKSAVENRMSPHSKFQERQFWSGLKLFHNILLWNELLPEDTLQELGLGKLLNRYLIIALLNAIPGPDVVKKCNQIAACLPEKWFQNSAMRTSIPQLENFIQFLLQSARKLSTSEIRDEVKEIILILVKIKALNHAESFIEEYHLDHLKSVIKEV
ncbi:intron Large complex component GCFC2 isoform X2 [Physeter macrocephalus]|uniref:Intron Large complex component GCFC2 isoform X2 n=1 Tax=Physeter macrocephalus TaxID=9755 RepID=A0A455BXY7_PHYMC|nr:intron Large complex component GCFC2 isoform X2 [Physeter catodon]|eukprot:XP_028352653.1 GC-rich sequence DNA-binding factor 2 isoform X3 [Physeter catodon]